MGRTNAKGTAMNATNTKRDDSAWRTYRETAGKVERLIAVLEGRLADHRIRARAHRDEWLYDADLRQVAERLEQAVDALRE